MSFSPVCLLIGSHRRKPRDEESSADNKPILIFPFFDDTATRGERSAIFRKGQSGPIRLSQFTTSFTCAFDTTTHFLEKTRSDHHHTHRSVRRRFFLSFPSVTITTKSKNFPSNFREREANTAKFESGLGFRALPNWPVGDSKLSALIEEDYVCYSDSFKH